MAGRIGSWNAPDRPAFFCPFFPRARASIRSKRTPRLLFDSAAGPPVRNREILVVRVLGTGHEIADAAVERAVLGTGAALVSGEPVHIGIPEHRVEVAPLAEETAAFLLHDHVADLLRVRRIRVGHLWKARRRPEL